MNAHWCYMPTIHLKFKMYVKYSENIRERCWFGISFTANRLRPSNFEKKSSWTEYLISLHLDYKKKKNLWIGGTKENVGGGYGYLKT